MGGFDSIKILSLLQHIIKSQSFKFAVIELIEIVVEDILYGAIEVLAY